MLEKTSIIISFALLKFFDGGDDGDGDVQRNPETWEAGNWFTKPFGLLSRKIRTQGDKDVAVARLPA